MWLPGDGWLRAGQAKITREGRGRGQGREGEREEALSRDYRGPAPCWDM